PGPLGVVDEIQGAQSVVLPPTAPVSVGFRAGGDLPLGILAVDKARLFQIPGHDPPPSDFSATQRMVCVPRPSIVPVSTSPSRRKRCQCWPLPAGLPVRSRSPGSSGVVCEAAEISAGMSNSRSEVRPSCLTSPLSSKQTPTSAPSTKWAGTRKGPVGRKPGEFFDRYQSVPISFISCRKVYSLVEMSLTMVYPAT